MLAFRLPMFFRFLHTIAVALLFVGADIAVATIDDGLVLHLPMRADLRDHSPKTHAVEISGRVELRDGAAWFGGKEDWLELPFIPLNERAFTVSMWLKPTGDGPTYGVLMQWDRNETNHILHLVIRDGWRPRFGFYVNDVVSPVSLSNAGGWQHLVFQYTGTHQQIWINGRLICCRVAESYRGTRGPTFIGRNPDWNNVPGRDYEGGMSDFRIYERALSFAEIVELSSTPPASKPAVAAVARPVQPAGSVAPPGVSAVPLLSIAADRMQLRGKAGEEYIVEASPDLIDWAEIGRFSIGSEGLAEFVDEDAKRFRQRFYRIRFRDQ